jgi:hypothetical protein
MTSRFLKFFGIASLALFAALSAGVTVGAKENPKPKPKPEAEAKAKAKEKDCKTQQPKCNDCPQPRGNPSPGKPKTNAPCP